MIKTRFIKLCSISLIAIGLTMTAVGCSGKKSPTIAGQAIEVKAMQVIKQDTPINYVYAGQVKAKNEVKLQTRVSGNVVTKMINGGDIVHKGQPLFRIDSRQYDSALLSARAQLSQSEASLNNASIDRARYEKLAAINAIAQQTLDTQRSTEQQHAATVEYNRANVQKAADDLADTIIVSPIDGRIDMNDLSNGNYVQAGSTVLATISSVDPVFVQFGMSENEYLNLSQGNNGTLNNDWGSNINLVLSNGSQYPLSGKIEQVDKGLAQNTGTLTLKAVFENPQKVLIPGMFARIEITGDIRKGALLVPQRAVQQILDKAFVTVIGEGDKAEPRKVKLGNKIGNLWLIEEGLEATDRVVVEGLTKIQPGTQLNVSMITLGDLQTSSN